MRVKGCGKEMRKDQLEVKGAMPYSPTKHFDKGKEKVTEHITVEEEDKHEIEQQFQLIHLDDEDEERITSALIRCKDAKIVSFKLILLKQRM